MRNHSLRTMQRQPQPDLLPQRQAAASKSRRLDFDVCAMVLITLSTFGLYALTLAPTVLRSDSGEFHVVPWVLGIAHAPGYPLLTLLGRAAMFIPVGDPAYRVNLLVAAASASAVGLVYLIVVQLATERRAYDLSIWPARIGGLAAGAALGLGAIYWQQSVVGGQRPFSFFFTALLLWLLFRWGSRPRTKELALLAAASGLALAHHPNQLMLFPGLAFYVCGRLLVSREHVMDNRAHRLRPFLLASLAFLLPLLLYLYLPIRSAMEPLLGAEDLADPRQLLHYVTARDSSAEAAVLDSCGSPESWRLQAQRYLVYLTLQLGPFLPLTALLGATLALFRAPLAGVTLLYAFGSNAAFGMCSSLAMPDYIVPSFVVAACWLGLGLAGVLPELASGPGMCSGLSRLATASAAVLVVGLSAYRVVTGTPHQSMSARTADAERARNGVAQIQARGLVLSDWESITPIWYVQHVLGLNRRIKSAMVTASPASDSWVVEVEKGLESGPVSLTQWVPALKDKYRLFPIGPLYETPQKPVLERSAAVGVSANSRFPALLSYHVDRLSPEPGDLVRLTLYQQRSDRGRDDSFLPVVRLAADPPVIFRFSPAQRHPVPLWANDEVVGEVYEFSVPTGLSPGELPLELSYQTEDGNRSVDLANPRLWTRIGSLNVRAQSGSSLAEPPDALANFANQLVLRGGKLGLGAVSLPIHVASDANTASSRASNSVSGPHSGLDLELEWSALRWVDESYTLFVHLLDSQHRLVGQQDGLPLGGVYHTYKWVPGQVITDWYRLPLPAGLAPGEYWLEIGVYQSATTRRLPPLNPDGGADKTSFLWGPIWME